MVKNETLRLANVPANGPELIRAALASLRGVTSVAPAASNDSVAVGFDDDLTSLLEVRAALRKAGIGVQRDPSSEEGLCCGSCGS